MAVRTVRSPVGMCQVGRRQGELSAVRPFADMVGSGVVPGLDDHDCVLIHGATPWVGVAFGVSLRAAVFGAGATKLAEGDRVGAALGEAVAAVAEHVGPTA